MSDIFLVFFLAIFFIGMILRGYFSRKSPDYKKSLGELKRQPLEHESRLSFGFQLLFGLFFFAGLIIYLFYTALFPWMQLPLLDMVRWIGVAIGLVSLPLVAWVQSALGASFSKTLTIQDDHELVTTGPYSRIRHPMYSVYTFWFGSWFLVSANLMFAISWVLWMIYLFIRIPQEEQMLLEQFGDSYCEYMNKTGRLIPRF
ncbi:MAG: isoprenylcysteine carboxylmethyltransferase family protein [Candidatus Thorarchaeota archaeon]|jgi:protein-S-isoprenylcysteine O-methyltransferase Ste14